MSQCLALFFYAQILYHSQLTNSTTSSLLPFSFLDTDGRPRMRYYALHIANAEKRPCKIGKLSSRLDCLFPFKTESRPVVCCVLKLVGSDLQSYLGHLEVVQYTTVTSGLIKREMISGEVSLTRWI